ncbi:endonuclease/exonuclease/phosphatase family protein [Streptomyces acidiscabies]|uniref:Endonuclease/exonuclease/phosphatase family protein n=1 Tax=Streptomyces acidiscabies TaxID=42234 RepID=A0AAP6B634_9ACTN|nr:endonuclease/exonuclease/phosphatase family protein [Streptomyces acidiscabies]MBP5940306.1 endonuclease [Streptomyces sp. LBUM 1476]MBZ3911539.1 endonuclease/exonuclease/phosphatase family protein [Streptomyces acidiscabies]MDX2958764.1 endonuclease/exonuclease/phosphatase family protein [Streptomyces acidiscabies]MDX3018202.1 endonuclease/exonuclease/phosphatase family protein [Streptomyces acidiscabies]MDX3791599.1 endonuclease/exonuclease/phosphatase family protein [Streptomyces acidisc
MLLGTWNLENLYRPGGPFGPKDKASYDTKLASLAERVEALAPDVLGVQEVGDPDALDDLLGVIGGTWHTALSAHPDGRGIRVGVISRAPLEVVADVNAFPHDLRPVQVDDSGLTVSATGRGLLAVRTGALHLAVAHLKSKLLTYPGNRFFPHNEGERARYGAYALYRRASEAVTLRALADDLLAGDGRARDVAVVGDLNDEVQAATTQILLGPPGSEIGTPGYKLPDQGDRARLWDVAPLIPAERRYSRVNSGRRELIDHILLSHQLVHRVTEAGTGTPSADGVLRLPSVNEDPRERRDASGSDHAPVWVRVG